MDDTSSYDAAINNSESAVLDDDPGDEPDASSALLDRMPYGGCDHDEVNGKNSDDEDYLSASETHDSDDDYDWSEAHSFQDRFIHNAYHLQHRMGAMAQRVKVEASELAHKVKEEAEEIAHKVKAEAGDFANLIYEAGWRVVHHASLPDWMRDNEFIEHGHRPELRSFTECFKSVFRIHTETGNIWTHLLGMIAFIGITGYFLSRPSIEVQWQEKAVFSAFFIGAILCLCLSWVFHTVCCHSSQVGRFFNKLDYCGISVLTVGSFVPWLYYCFYCRLTEKISYLVLIFTLGIACTLVALLDFFATPKYRPLRAAMFIALGLSGVIPAMHFVITDGFYEAVNNASLGWLCLMALFYIAGAVIYAIRIPERIWPGKFDIWFHSHQIFHIFVVAGALVHYHGISQIANYRLTEGGCLDINVI